MSLTQTRRVFASIHEDALNDLLRAFFTARPRHLRYGSPAFVPATSVSATQMPSIAFPGLPGGVEWSVRFEVPKVDLHPETGPLPPELTLAPGAFSLHTAVEICLNCARRRDDRDERPDDRDDDRKGKPPGLGKVVCTQLRVFALGHLDAWNTAGGNGEIRFRVDAVELVDIAPESLESLLECLIRMLLDAALSQVSLPLQALRAGAFQLLVTQGPLIEDDHILARGNV